MLNCDWDVWWTLKNMLESQKDPLEFELSTLPPSSDGLVLLIMPASFEYHIWALVLEW